MKTWATTSPTAHFYLTNDPDIAQKYHLSGEKEDVVFLKLHDEGKAIYSEEYNEVNVENLAHFYTIHENPRIFDFTKGLIDKLEKEKRAVVVLFAQDVDHQVSKYFTTAAESFRGHQDIVFARSDLKSHGPTDALLMKITGVTEIDFPAIRILDFSSGVSLVTKYKYPRFPKNPSDLIDFVYQFEKRNLKEYKRSEKIDAQEGSSASSVQTLTRGNSKAFLHNPTVPSLLLIHSPSLICSQCPKVRLIP